MQDKTQSVIECETIRKNRETLLSGENNRRRVINKTVDLNC